MRSPLTSTAVSASPLPNLVASSSPWSVASPWHRRLSQRVLVAVLLAAAMFCLTGCGKQGPDAKLIKRAIALEFGQAQVELSQQLKNQVPKFKIERVEIATQTPLRIEGEAAVRIRGQYDVSIRFPDQRYRQTDNDFDLYLQQQGDTNFWRLAIPQPKEGTVSQPWQTYLLTNPLEDSV